MKGESPAVLIRMVSPSWISILSTLLSSIQNDSMVLFFSVIGWLRMVKASSSSLLTNGITWDTLMESVWPLGATSGKTKQNETKKKKQWILKIFKFKKERIGSIFHWVLGKESNCFTDFFSRKRIKLVDWFFFSRKKIKLVYWFFFF